MVHTDRIDKVYIVNGYAADEHWVEDVFASETEAEVTAKRLSDGRGAGYAVDTWNINYPKKELEDCPKIGPEAGFTQANAGVRNRLRKG